MNLELIRKYEKEFLHMLHGGDLLVKCTDEDNAPHKDYLDWHCDDYVFESDLDYLIVIDDIYLPYRKALAEGKTIQYQTALTWGEDWLDMGHDGCKPFTRSDYINIRIKPEEPEFKIGDYVRYIHANSPKPLQIVNINCERYYFENSEIILRLDEIEKWEPREGEVCIFWHNNTSNALISKFAKISNYDNCMPFTGVLPPHMKD